LAQRHDRIVSACTSLRRRNLAEAESAAAQSCECQFQGLLQTLSPRELDLYERASFGPRLESADSAELEAALNRVMPKVATSCGA
jgi:hypothetical protein